MSISYKKSLLIIESLWHPVYTGSKLDIRFLSLHSSLTHFAKNEAAASFSLRLLDSKLYSAVSALHLFWHAATTGLVIHV